jgi:bacterioferritin
MAHDRHAVHENTSPLSDTETLRQRARKNVSEGAVTRGYLADRATVLRLLDTALATELVCVLRYKRHAFTAKGIDAEPLVEEFEQHAKDEQGHVDQIAERIVQLGGSPDFDPVRIAERAHSEYDDSEDLVSMIREDLVAERIAIESYAEIIRFVGDGDPTTRRMLEGILANEEDHADDLVQLLARMGPRGAA